ncbi:MAG: preprotein translocase subunit SecA [Clostridium sp.]
MGIMSKIFGSYNEREVKRLLPTVDKIMALDEEMSKLTDEELKNKTFELKERLANGQTLEDILVEAFAVVREGSWRVLKMKHYREQLIGGMVLHQGRVAEMKTGEGKTLVATCPAYLNALAGKGVHIITVNDYLAERDKEEMGQVYNFLGLTTGVILHDMEPDARREAYKCDITYGTNSEFGFDYLRDNMVAEPVERVQRTLHYGIVDEVDSIFIDEARTPLIISGQGNKSNLIYKRADRFAKSLKKEEDYVIDEKTKAVMLTEDGIAKAEEYFQVEDFTAMENMEVQHHTIISLRANYVMHNGVDYIIREGEIMIVDQFTGRVMEGRRFSEGLHQAIEAKEAVKINEENDTLATITYQNYFKLYKKLSGMSGTVETEEKEFREIYNLDVVVVPTHRPIARIDREDVIYKTEFEKFKAVAEDIAETYKKGQPVLVGTASVEKSEILSFMLKKKGIPHQVLNAKEHGREAEIVARAGEVGTVTIATNMAGRGTDIKLGEGVVELGGLKIIGTERHEARRIDNQLRGRSGRQGDVGESVFYVSLEDEVVTRFAKERLENIEKSNTFIEGESIDTKKVRELVNVAQTNVESHHFETRKDLVKYDQVLDKQRVIIYDQRNEIVEQEDISENIKTMIEDVVSSEVELHLTSSKIVEEEMDSLLVAIEDIIGSKKELNKEELLSLKKEEIKEKLLEAAFNLYEEKKTYLKEAIMRLQKSILLRVVDRKWIEHIETMGNLKKYIALQAYNQKDPLISYQLQGGEVFEDTVYGMKKEVARHILHINIEPFKAEMAKEEAKGAEVAEKAEEIEVAVD